MRKDHARHPRHASVGGDDPAPTRARVAASAGRLQPARVLEAALLRQGVLPDLRGRVTEEVVEGEELGEGTGLCVVVLGGEDEVTDAGVVSVLELETRARW